MNAEQYRALVAKLEAIQEAAPDEVAQQVAMAASNTQAAPADGTTAAPAEVPAATTTAQDPNQIPTIEAATFSQAYAQARKQGLKKFKWCGIYAVKDPVKPQPAASTVQPRFYSQGPSDAMLKDKFGRPLPKANQDLIRKSYDDSSSAGGAAG